MRYWEIIADRLTKRGWTWGCSTIWTINGTVFVVDAYRQSQQRFIVHSDEKLTAFLEIEAHCLAEES
jgi:hypothetical protein